MTAYTSHAIIQAENTLKASQELEIYGTGDDMEVGPNLLLNLPLRLPVRIREIDEYPKLIAGGIPVVPINLVLRQRKLETGATGASISTYIRAACLYGLWQGFLPRTAI